MIKPKGRHWIQERESPLRLLRLEKGLSQQAVAKKMGLARNQLVRFEKRPLTRLAVGDLLRVSECLGYQIADVLTHLNGHTPADGMMRSDLKKPEFVVESVPGIRYGSFLRNSPEYFIGTVSIAARQSLAKARTPKGRFVFYLILEGVLLLQFESKECLFKRGEYFAIQNAADYELYNSHQFESLSALLITLPSFLPSQI